MRTTIKTLMVVLLALAWAPVVSILALLSWWIVVLVSFRPKGFSVKRASGRA